MLHCKYICAVNKILREINLGKIRCANLTFDEGEALKFDFYFLADFRFDKIQKFTKTRIRKS